MRIVVYGLWHLGCVTAACLAKAGHVVAGLDPDARVVEELQRGRPPLHEPGLAELVRAGLASKQLSFHTDAAIAAKTDILWVTFDTAVNDRDDADAAAVRARLEEVCPFLKPGTMVLLSSQVPVGFTRALQRDWSDKRLRFAYSPENLRLGKAIDIFCRPDRVVLGVDAELDRAQLTALFSPFCPQLEWMSLESAEMTKHALNAFLAMSVAFINEIARLCEEVGADAKEVERGLKSEARIGPRAYLAPGAAFAGGTLARDLRYLVRLGQDEQVSTPLLQGVLDGNDIHKNWLRDRVEQLLFGIDKPVAALLGLTYKPGTNTLRRSPAVELARWMHERGVRVRCCDPALATLPVELHGLMEVASDPLDALNESHLIVIFTGWPSFRSLKASDVAERMRRPCVIDPNHFLADELGRDPRIHYFATGKRAA